MNIPPLSALFRNLFMRNNRRTKSIRALQKARPVCLWCPPSPGPVSPPYHPPYSNRFLAPPWSPSSRISVSYKARATHHTSRSRPRLRYSLGPPRQRNASQRSEPQKKVERTRREKTELAPGAVGVEEAELTGRECNPQTPHSHVPQAYQIRAATLSDRYHEPISSLQHLWANPVTMGAKPLTRPSDSRPGSRPLRQNPSDAHARGRSTAPLGRYVPGNSL